MKNKLFLSLSLLTAAFTFASPEINNVMENMATVEAQKNQAIAADLATRSRIEYEKQVAARLAAENSRLGRTKNAVKEFGAYVADSRVGQALVQAGSFAKDKAVKAGSFAKANTWNRSLFGYKNGGKYATAGAGLIAATGLGYLAYKKYGKAKTVKAVKRVTIAPVVGSRIHRKAAERKASGK